MRAMYYHVLCLFALCFAANAAKPEDNFVLLSKFGSTDKKTYAMGVWLKDQVVIGDNQSFARLKFHDQIRVTFFAGQSSEFTIMGKAEQITGPGTAYILIDSKKVPSGNKLPEGMELDLDQIKPARKVKVWRKTQKGFAGRITKVDTVWDKIFSLTGYPTGASGYPVTTEDGKLLGACVSTQHGMRVCGSPLIKSLVDGEPGNFGIVIKNYVNQEYEYQYTQFTRDPFGKLVDRLSVIYWTGPRYLKRAKNEHGALKPGLPGDSKVKAVLLKKPAKQTDPFEALFRTKVPFDKILYFGHGILGNDGKLEKILHAVEIDSTRYRMATHSTPKDMEPYKPSDKTFVADLPERDATKAYPVMDLTKIDLRALFPHSEGNQWLYHRTAKFDPHITPGVLTGVTYGYLSEPINDKGDVFHKAQCFGENSTHDELYTVTKRTGDRFWVKVEASKNVVPANIRDGRFKDSREYFMQWGRKNSVTDLQEVRKLAIKKEIATLGNPVLQLKDADLPRTGNCITWSNDQRKVIFSLKGLTARTPAGVFKGCVVREETGQLSAGARYILQSYFYPGVGMVYEKFKIVGPRVSGNVIMTDVGTDVYELTLKTFKVSKDLD